MNSIIIVITGANYRIRYRPANSHESSDPVRVSSWDEVLELCKQAAPLYRVEIDIYIRNRMPLEFPDCIRLDIAMRWHVFETPWIDGFSKIPSLQELHVRRIKFDRVPSLFRVKRLTLTCHETPYWLLETTDMHLQTDGAPNWEIYLRCLRDVLEFYLLCPETRFGRWLTKGLYDPRLLFKLRDFLL